MWGDWSNASTRQGMPRITGIHWKLRGGKEGFKPKTSERTLRFSRLQNNKFLLF